MGEITVEDEKYKALLSRYTLYLLMPIEMLAEHNYFIMLFSFKHGGTETYSDPANQTVVFKPCL